MIKEINLYKLWEIMNKLSYEETKLSEEQEKWVSLLGNSSNYCQQEFDSFLGFYSFKVDGEYVVVFNTDPIPYEDYTRNDFSPIPICLLSFSAKKIEEWMETEIQKQLEEQKQEKEQRKKYIESEINRLEKQLKEL